MDSVYFIRVEYQGNGSSFQKEKLLKTLTEFLKWNLKSITEIKFFEHFNDKNEIMLYATKDLEKVLGEINSDLAFSVQDDYIQKIVVGLIGE